MAKIIDCPECKERNVIHYARGLCNKCYRKLFQKKYSEEYYKTYYENNKESICKYQKEYRKNNKDKLAQWQKKHYRKKYKSDELFRIKALIRVRINEAFNLYSATGKIKKTDKYGIDYKAIINHLGPCPGKREEYHIDHIFPLSAFNFDNSEHIRLAFAPENHQWLKTEDNLSKGATYNKTELDKYLKG